MSNKEYEYKFDTVKPPEDRVYDDRVMHYYENHSNEPARPLILALGKHITDRVLYKLPWLPKVGKELTVNDPEYWGLASIVTDEMAEVALKMKVHKGMKLKEIIKATGKSAAYLEPLLKEMANIGLVEFNWENPEHEKQYVLPMFVPGSAEFFNMKWDNICEHPQVANFFERMTQLPLEAITPMVPPGGAGIGMHVIPVEKAISMENQSADVEHISHWLDKYDGKYAAGPCSCRYSRAMCGEGCADDPEDWCIGVGDMADYLVETNKGHYITREMVMEILQRAEDNGFVHQITNIDGENKIFAICNCQVKVCNALRTSQLFNTPNMSRSAYVAKVEAKDCVACGKCVEFCPAGAVKLGQKLCKKDGSAVTYPKQELPDAVKWGKEKWSPDYRDKNRINCYDTGTAPCKTACPAHIAVQGYLKMAAQGRYTDALALIKKDNPFPAVCGRVCNKRCEEACTRATLDEAVAIDDVKRFIAQKDLDSKTRYIPKKVIPSNRGEFKNKIAIIGGGPAGLSCAYYLALTGYRPIVFEKNEKPGGMLTYGIPSYKLEKDVVEAEIDIIRALGVEIKCGVEVGKDITLDELRKDGYESFYIAIGCQGSRKSGVDGEDADGVMSAVDILHEIAENHDLNLKGNKTVVIGGGNVAVDVARSTKRCGADVLGMFCLESREEMPASEEEIFETEDEGIQINNGWGVKEILAENGKVTGVVLKKCTSVKDADGKFNPQYDENDTQTIECDRIYLSIGQSIEWGNLIDGEAVELGRGNAPQADSLTYQTGQKDIFVGGDVYTGPRFAIDAIAAGREGAESIHRFVHFNASLTVGRNRRDFIMLDKNDILVDSYDNSSRQIPNINKKIDAKSSFKDAHLPLTEEQVKKETARCLGCGASVVDENKCIGCGICTTKCEFDAIHLFRDNPECSTMVNSDDKMKAILPYMIKRNFKIKKAQKAKKDYYARTWYSFSYH